MAVDLAKLRDMEPVLLDKEEMTLRADIWKLRLQMTTGQVQDPQLVRRRRRDLARLLTIRTEQKLGIQSGSRPQSKAKQATQPKKATKATKAAKAKTTKKTKSPKKKSS